MSIFKNTLSISLIQDAMTPSFAEDQPHRDALLKNAQERGYVAQLSYTQWQWKDEGLTQARRELGGNTVYKNVEGVSIETLVKSKIVYEWALENNLVLSPSNEMHVVTITFGDVIENNQVLIFHETYPGGQGVRFLGATNFQLN